MLTDKQVKKHLWETGHYFAPEVLEIDEVSEDELDTITLKDKVSIAALRSYQDLFGAELQLLAAKRKKKFHAPHDGKLESLTRELLEIPRCGRPDFEHPSKLRAIGRGSWPEPCQKKGVKVHIDKSRMPASLQASWPAIQADVFASYAMIGLKLIEVATTGEANVHVMWQVLIGSTIGLAEFNSQSCSDQVFCKLDPGYNGYLRSLFAHELGHNCNFQHTQGGIMHPSIRPDPNPFGWHQSDPTYPVAVRFFGGEPIDVTPPPVDPPPTDGGTWTLKPPIKLIDANGKEFNLIQWPKV